MYGAKVGPEERERLPVERQRVHCPGWWFSRENAAFRGLGSKAPTGRHADAEFRQIGTWPHNAAHYIQKR